MQTIPLALVPSQKLSVQLGGQTCVISIKQRSTGLYLDLSANSVPMLIGCLCRDRTAMVRSLYLGFSGDLTFIDTQGTSDPDYTGVGVRFILAYLTPTELIPFQIV